MLACDFIAHTRVCLIGIDKLVRQTRRRKGISTRRHVAVNSDEKPRVSLSNLRPLCGRLKTNFATTLFGQASRGVSVLGEKGTCVANVFSAKIRAIIFARHNRTVIICVTYEIESGTRPIVFRLILSAISGASGSVHTRSPYSCKTQTLVGGSFNLVRSLFEPALADGDLLKR